MVEHTDSTWTLDPLAFRDHKRRVRNASVALVVATALLVAAIVGTFLFASNTASTVKKIVESPCQKDPTSHACQALRRSVLKHDTTNTACIDIIIAGYTCPAPGAPQSPRHHTSPRSLVPASAGPSAPPPPAATPPASPGTTTTSTPPSPPSGPSGGSRNPPGHIPSTSGGGGGTTTTPPPPPPATQCTVRAESLGLCIRLP